MAETENTELIKKLKSLPDLTAEVTMHRMPSVIISSPDDSRIESVARLKNQSFIVRSEGKTSFVVLVNPKIVEGYLWWKKAARRTFSGNHWANLLSGLEPLTPEEKRFLETF